MNIDTLAQISGWTGTVLFLVAYFLVSFKKADATSRRYQFLNLIGALFLGFNVFHAQAWPALALEVVWGSIAVITLLRRNKTVLK